MSRRETGTSITVTSGHALATDPGDPSQILGAFDFAAQDSLGRLEEASFWLETHRHGIAHDALRAFEMVDCLDNRAQPERLAVMREYLNWNESGQTDRQHRIWRAVFRYACELALSYEMCFALLRPSSKQTHQLTSLEPIIAARTLRALSLQVRYALLRYMPVEATVWGRMGSLYAFSERRLCATIRRKVYPGMHEDSTVRREYLRGLLLAASGMDDLEPNAQIVADRIIVAVADFFLLDCQPRAGCHFAVALGGGMPYRISENIPSNRNVRFFGPGDAGVIVDGYLRHTVETQSVPNSFRLNGNFDVTLVENVLRHLSRHWAATAPDCRSGQP